MDGTELKELFKISIDRIREKTIYELLEADKDYQADVELCGRADF